MNHPHLPDSVAPTPSAAADSSPETHAHWAPAARWQPAPEPPLPAARVARLRRGVHGVALNIIDTVKRLEAWALPGFARRTIATAVGPVRLLEWGTPSPTHASWLFIHGYAAQAVDWRPVLQRLRHHCQHLVAVDMPGHGDSPVPPGGISESTLLVALRDALDTCVGSAPCVLVGNSTGGLGAIRLVQMVGPQRICGVVLISPLGGPMTPEEIDAVLTRFDITSVRQGLAFVDRLYNNGTHLRVIQALGAWAHLNRPHLRHMIAQLRSFAFLHESELSNLPPTLVIWGDGDRILPSSGRSFFHDALPHAEHAHPADFGHAPYLDRANALHVLLTQWASRHAGMLLR